MEYIEVDISAAAGGFIKSIIFVEKIEAIQKPKEEHDEIGALILTERHGYLVKQNFEDLKNMFGKLSF